MYAFSGILAALYARTTSREGTSLDVSLFDALGEWMSPQAYYTSYGGVPPPRTGANHASIAPYGPFESREGGPVYLGIQNTREWTRFCAEVLRQPHLADDERFRTNPLRVVHRVALHADITRVFCDLSADDIIARLESAGIAHARMNSVAGFVGHPQLSARDRWRDIDSPVGPLRALAPPVNMEDVEPVMGAVPALGQHSDAILNELGYDGDTIAAWRRNGVI
jgi:crotonobetainyl-CoA:carnitine CoA-transferase CaiB-like acyl-CoA transferase